MEYIDFNIPLLEVYLFPWLRVESYENIDLLIETHKIETKLIFWKYIKHLLSSRRCVHVSLSDFLLRI